MQSEKYHADKQVTEQALKRSYRIIHKRCRWNIGMPKCCDETCTSDESGFQAAANMLYKLRITNGVLKGGDGKNGQDQ